MNFDWQQIVALAIVAAAFWVVGQRLWSLISAFRKRPPRRKRKPGQSAASPSATPLIQIQVKPPAHIKRPPSDDR